MNKRFAFHVLSILLVGSFLRITYLAQLKRTPFGNHPTGDSASYVARAKEIAQGDLLGNQPFFLASPGYPYYLSLFLLSKGPNLWTPLYIQSFLGLISAALLALTARVLWGERAGRFAAILCVLYGPFLFFEGELLASSWEVFCVCLGLYSTARWHQNPELKWVGLPWAFGVFFRPTLLSSALGLGCFAAWTRGRDASRKEGAIALALFVLPGLMSFSLLTWRNWKVCDDFIPGASSAGINFYIGNHLNATGSYDAPETWGAQLEERSTQEAETALGRTLKPSEVSRYWFLQGLAFAREQPVAWLKVLARKCLLLLNRYEVPNHYDYLAFHEYIPLLRLPLVQFSWIAPLAFASLVLSPIRRKAHFLWLFLAFQAGTILPFFVTDRYRLPMVPALILLSAATILACIDFVYKKEFRNIGKSLLAFLVAFLCVNLPQVPQADPAGMKVRLGQIYMEKGWFDRAEKAFLEGTRSNPKSLTAWHGAALSALRSGKPQIGLQRFEILLEQRPDWSVAYVGAASCLDAMGLLPEAREYLERALASNPGEDSIRWNLWKLRLKEEGPEDILEVADRELLENPLDLPALRARIACLSMLGRNEEAKDTIKKGLLAYPEEPELLMDCARLHMSLEQPDQAEDIARRLMRSHPSRGDVYNLMGIIEAQRNNLDEAILLLEQALQLQPGDSAAHSNLERARRLKQEKEPPRKTP